MNRPSILLAALPTLAALLACAGNLEVNPEVPVAAAAAPEPEAPAEPEPPPEAPPFTLTSVEAGDASCYLGVTSAAGEASILPGAFELCPGGPSDATPHLGKKLTVTTEKASVIAPSCGGNPECEDHVLVDLVTAVEVAP